jgi:hypothetical protein
MGAFVQLGFIFGMMGFIFGAAALGQVSKLKKDVERLKVERNP